MEKNNKDGGIKNNEDIPYLGVGMGFRREISRDIFANRDKIEVLEITSEHFINANEERLDFLKKILESFPIVPHGLKLSVGSSIDLDMIYLKKLKRISDFIKSPYYSDHFAVTQIPGLSIGHLSPIWFTKEGLDLVVDKIKKVQDFLQKPLVLENITSFFEIPEADLKEAEFISEATRRTGCGILLDLTNININGFNRKKDPYEFLKNIPLDKIVHIHLAGGRVTNNWFYDTHSEELGGENERVWPLLEWVAENADPKVVIIERDSNFKEDFQAMVLNDIARARKIMDTSRSRKKSKLSLAR